MMTRINASIAFDKRLWRQDIAAWAIADLIRGGLLSSQEELAERLSALGFTATQAAISRDLDQLGAVKLRRDGRII